MKMIITHILAFAAGFLAVPVFAAFVIWVVADD